MRKHDHSLLSNAAALVICGLLAGLVVAAAAFPAIAVTGLAAKAGADDFDNLPSALAVRQTDQATNVYASDGKTLIASIYDENRRDVALDAIAPVMLKAIVASEDTRFYQHHGVDIHGVVRAFVNNSNDSGDTQGASTLTMQYVRLQTLYTATTPQEALEATQNTVTRKLREMHEAMAVEEQMTKQFNGNELAAKQEILRRYLNIAPFGPNTYGVYAASETYFDEPPIDLTVSQAALLAGLVQSPSVLNPQADSKDPGVQWALDRRNTHVLKAMLTNNSITQAVYETAIKQPLGLKYQAPKNGCTAATNLSWGYFCDYLQRWWDSQEAFGADDLTRENQLETGGYKIVTTLNIADQKAADASIAARFKKTDPRTMMLAGIQPGTGQVQLMAVNRTFSNSTDGNGKMLDPTKYASGETTGNYPNTTLPLISGDDSIDGYQFGSTFKMFTMIAALQDGLPLNYTINTQYKYYANYTDHDPDACNGLYCPHNASASEAGPYNMWTGFGHSINTYFIPLEDRMSAGGDQNTGPTKAVKVAQKLGITFPDGVPDYDSFTLGVNPTFPLEMAAAYAAVDDQGMYCTPTPVISITDFNGNKLDVGQPQCSQAIDPDIANAAMDAARCPVGQQGAAHKCTGGTASNTQGFGMSDRPFAGKSGTTDNGIADAFIGMTPQLTVAGEYTDTDWGLDPTSLSGKHSDVNYAVAKTMAAAMKGQPKLGWKAESESLMTGTPTSSPSITACESQGAAISSIRGHGLRYVIQLKRVDSACPSGTVASIDPTGTTSKNAVVAIYLSDGTATVVTPPPGSNPPTGNPTGPPVTNPPGNPGGGGGGGGGGGNGCPKLICGLPH